LEAQRARAEKLAGFRKLLEIGTEEDFIKAMRAFGLREARNSSWLRLRFGATTDLSHYPIESTPFSVALRSG
jgi:hypothetical protein